MSGKTREQQLDELLDKQAIYELIMAYWISGSLSMNSIARPLAKWP